MIKNPKIAIAFGHTIYISIISFYMIWSLLSYYSPDPYFSPTSFYSYFFYSLNVAVHISVALTGIVCIAFCLKRSNALNLYQTLWWIPQLLFIVVIRFHNSKRVGSLDSIIYQASIGPNFFFELGFGVGPYQSQAIFFRLNIVALIGIIVAFLTINQFVHTKSLESEA